MKRIKGTYTGDGKKEGQTIPIPAGGSLRAEFIRRQRPSWWFSVRRMIREYSPVKIRREGEVIGNGIGLQWWRGPRVHFRAGRLRATLGWHERLKLEAWVAWRAVGNDHRLVAWDAGRRKPTSWKRGTNQ